MIEFEEEKVEQPWQEKTYPRNVFQDNSQMRKYGDNSFAESLVNNGMIREGREFYGLMNYIFGGQE